MESFYYIPALTLTSFAPTISFVPATKVQDNLNISVNFLRITEP